MTAALEPLRDGRVPRLRLDALLVALATGAGLVLIALPGAEAVRTVTALGALVPILAFIAVEDTRRLTIPDLANLALGLLALAWRISAAIGDGETLSATAMALAIDLLLSGGVLWAFRELYFRLKGFDGLGFGDVKLAAAGGVLLGAGGFAFALLLGSLCGLIFVLARRLVTRRAPATGLVEPLPFGAFLAPAFLIAWIVPVFAIVPVMAERIG